MKTKERGIVETFRIISGLFNPTIIFPCSHVIQKARVQVIGGYSKPIRLGDIILLMIVQLKEEGPHDTHQNP